MARTPVKQRKTIPAKGDNPPISFHPGGLHESLGVGKGKKLTPAEHAKAASGKAGPKAAKQERFYENVLKH